MKPELGGSMKIEGLIVPLILCFFEETWPHTSFGPGTRYLHACSVGTQKISSDCLIDSRFSVSKRLRQRLVGLLTLYDL